jgi:hypothetical protein
MNLRHFILACCCLFLVQDLVAQVYYIDRRFWHGENPIHPEDDPFEFDVFPYTSPMLDMRNFKLAHPEIADRVPEYIEIVPPNVSQLTNVSFAVAWVGIKDGDESEGHLLLMVVGNFVGEQPRYFIDRNMDQVLINDGEPVVFYTGHTSEKITFQRDNAENPDFEFWLMAPSDFEEFEYQLSKGNDKIPHPDEVPETMVEEITGDSAMAHTARQAELIAVPEKAPAAVRRFGIRFGITFGLNRIQYSYRKASSGFPVDYEVSNSAKGLFCNFNYRHRGLRVGFLAGLEHVLWWSSFKTIRVSDPFEICDPNSGNCVLVEGVEVERNRDRLPQLRVNLGINLEYLFEFIPRVRLGPYITPMVSSYRPGHYIPDVAYRGTKYKLGPDLSFEGGLRVELRPTDNQTFMFSACWTEVQFRPKGFFENESDIRLNGLYTQNRGLRAYLGYSILL